MKNVININVLVAHEKANTIIDATVNRNLKLKT
jgi:hypothetical protein